MPRYDFRCLTCDYKEEKIMRMGDLDMLEILCPKCEEKGKIHPMARLISKQGATLGDKRVWLASTTEMLKGSDAVNKDPVASMTEYKKLLKEKGLNPIG